MNKKIDNIYKELNKRKNGIEKSKNKDTTSKISDSDNTLYSIIMNNMESQLNVYIDFINKIQKILKLQNGDIKNETCRNQILNKIIKLSVNDNKLGKTINTKMCICRQQYFKINGKNKKVEQNLFDNHYQLYPAYNFKKKKDFDYEVQKKFEHLKSLSPYKRNHSTKKYIFENKYFK